MMGWLKRWSERLIEREIARRVEETRRLKERIERETGEPIKLTAQERAKLERLAEGIDTDTLEKISVLGVDDTSTSEAVASRPPTKPK